MAIVLSGVLSPSARALDPEPLPFPVYLAGRIEAPITVDGELNEASWRLTSLGWGLSHSIEPNVLCPDPTLFRIGCDGEHVCLSLACYQREAQDDLPEELWKPRETDIMDLQAVPRYSRMRGVAPPVNTADVLISHDGRTVTLHFAPPEVPTVKVHDALGERDLPVELEYAYGGDPKKALWTAEVRATWAELGFEPPASGDEWALNVYRDIRFFSNWSFIAWMRRWDKAEYSRYDMVDRFGRIFLLDESAYEAVSSRIGEIAGRRGPVRVFAPDRLVLLEPGEDVVVQRYSERLDQLRRYSEEIFRDRRRIGNDLPYYPFYPEKKPREHLIAAAQKLNRLRVAMSEAPAWDDPASLVARIAHALPEARQGLYAYKKERLYRGLPE
jgi:hypothetical protein